MIIKCLEIRDRATCIPAIAIQMISLVSYYYAGTIKPNTNDIQEVYLRRCGYPDDGSGIVLMKLDNQEAHSDPYDWPNRTMRTAHEYILQHFDDLPEGSVVDAEFVLGESASPKSPEIWTG